MWQARTLLLDHEQQGVAVAVVKAWRMCWRSPRSRPCTITPQNQVRPVSSERRSDSWFIQAIIGARVLFLDDGRNQAVVVEVHGGRFRTR